MPLVEIISEFVLRKFEKLWRK